MDCPRCGGTIEVFRLGDGESVICPDCAYVGIPTEHGADTAETESWDVALRRFREAARGSDQADEPGEGASEVPGPASGTPSRRADPIDGLEVPGDDRVRARRREAIRELYEALRTEGEATRSELLAELSVSDHGYQSAESFWANAGRQGLRELPGVVPPGEGGPAWGFRPGKG